MRIYKLFGTAFFKFNIVYFGILFERYFLFSCTFTLLYTVELMYLMYTLFMQISQTNINIKTNHYFLVLWLPGPSFSKHLKFNLLKYETYLAMIAAFSLTKPKVEVSIHGDFKNV